MHRSETKATLNFMAHEKFLVANNYLKIVARNFYRNRSYPVFNLIGLAIGFASFIFALAYVYFETNFESFHRKANRIYRATYQYAPPGDYQSHWARIPFDYINELPKEIQGVETLVRFQNHARKYVRVNEQKFKPTHAYVADNDVFRLFNFDLVAGNPERALSQPGSIVISESLAKIYFGRNNPIDKEIFVISDLDSVETIHRVTGVMKDLPLNTHLPVDMLISFKDNQERSGWAYTYILLEEGANIAQVQSQMPEFIRKHSTEEEAKYDAIIFQPLSDIHLRSDLARELVPNGNPLYVNIVGFAGLLILVMALINFANLSSAMALNRAKEIGMRKIMGAGQKQLIGYLMMESVVNTMAALVVGAGIAYFLFPYFQRMIVIEFLPELTWFVPVLVVVAIISGIVAGSYPVLLLTSLKAITVLKTTKTLAFAGKERSFSFKRIMVTLQFTISILLVGSTFIAYNQFNYLLNRNMGMERDQVLALPAVPDPVKAKFMTFKNRLAGQPGIESVSGCMEVPSREIRDAGPVLVEGVNSDPAKAPVMDIQIIDPDFTSLLGLKLVAGRNIKSGQPQEQEPKFSDAYTIQQYLLEQPREYLVNETAMRQLGWTSPQDAIGQKISWSIGDMVLAYGPITGVVHDFHQESLKNKVDPVVMVREPIWLRTFLVKTHAQNIQQSVKSISRVWNELFPFYPMEYFFLDDLYNNLYQGERVQIHLLFVFSALAVLIAFIGLVGLVAYALKTRTKEIAVRKVLGAGLADIIQVISREYLFVIVVSAAIAIPISIYSVKEWLSEFAYRVDISPLSYLATLVVIVALIMLTIAVQTLFALRANPARTLRDD
jgi:putative ABC transport system permease protein